MIRIRISQPVRRNLVWRYCAAVSFVVYVYAFYSLIAIITSGDSKKTLRYEYPESFSQELRLFSTVPVGMDPDQHREAVIADNSPSLEANDVNKRANVILENSDQTSETDTGFLFEGVWKSILHFFQFKQAVLESRDSADLVIPHAFESVINASALCRDMGDVFLVVYVHSAPGNQRRRMVIRQTWGDVSQYDVTIRVIFVMGVSTNGLENEELQFEADAYGDIVQERFTDSYRNLTYKALAALKWISNCGSRSKFVLKTDDDIFVNIFVLVRHLRLQLDRCSPQPCRGQLFCLVWENMIVMRDGKWKVEETEWKESTYPKYCSGSAFIMSTDVATSLLRASLEVPFFWVDDVYVTGLLPVRAGGISHTDYASHYLLDGKQLAEKFTGSLWYNYIFSHVQDLNSILSVWKKVAAISRGDMSPTIQFRIE